MQLHRKLSLAVLTLALCAPLLAREPAKPQIVNTPPPTTMDSPIPPGAEAPPTGVQVSEGMGYCVTYEGARVDVPLHRPDRQKLDELRGSIRNALSLVANQLDVRATVESDQVKRQGIARRAQRLKAKAARGIAFAGEPEAIRFVMIGSGDEAGIVCSCSTLQTPGVMPSGYSCSGACGNCYSCR